jgi:regulator of protease activity HflC (stomatin/prohibitin superfamily)
MSSEKSKETISGWPMLVVALGMWLCVPLLIVFMALVDSDPVTAIGVVTEILLIPAAILMSLGFFTLQPNEARVLVLFGEYVGTVRKEGFHWANPFSVQRGGWVTMSEQGKTNQPQVVRRPTKCRVSLRARNFETQRLKVNDQRGNPIEIGTVVVWFVRDTAQALFDVDDYENYVKVQSETAVRHLASCYPYDHSDADPESETTLRGNAETICVALAKELQARLDKAGVEVVEARLTHLAYAQEIAGAMLRRQQAEAIISARQKIVHGAVSMVEMALTELSQRNVLNLDEERKAAMVCNLLVVLCGDHNVEPVINTGTLYH